MLTGLTTWLKGLSWFIKIGTVVMLIFLLWTGWGIARHWWRPALPKPEKTVEQATQAEQDRIDLAAVKASVLRLQAQNRQLSALAAKLTADTARSGAAVEKPLADAIKSGEPKALAAVGNQWFVPGTAARLADESLRREPRP